MRGLYRVNQYRPRSDTFADFNPIKRHLPLRNIPWPIQSYIVKIHLTRTTGDCRVALVTQTDSNPVNVSQIYALVDKSL